MFEVAPAWHSAFPGAHAGILVMRGVSNPAHHAELELRKGALEESLRARFAGQDRAAIKALPAIQAYQAYYKRFDKTYHIQLQLESVALKGKPIPRVAALVEAMFMAELKNLLLTAGHDLDRLQLPIGLHARKLTLYGSAIDATCLQFTQSILRQHLLDARHTHLFMPGVR